MPDVLDVIGAYAAFGAELGDRGLGETRRDADAQRAGDQLQKRPSAGLVERIEPTGEPARQVDLAALAQPLHDLGEGQRREIIADLSRRGLYTGPEQGDGLGEIADEIIGQFEQDRIDALIDQGADEAGLGVLKGQGAGQGGERIAAFGIGRRTEVIRHQPQLAEARMLEGEAVEEFGEAVHALSPTPFSEAGGASASSSP